MTDLCGLSSGYVSRVERGERQAPEAETLDLLAAALRVAVPYLRHGKPPEQDAVARFELEGLPAALNGALRLRMLRGAQHDQAVLATLAELAQATRFAVAPRKSPPSILDWLDHFERIEAEPGAPLNFESMLEGLPEPLVAAAIDLIETDGPGLALPSLVIEAAIRLYRSEALEGERPTRLAWSRELDKALHEINAARSRSLLAGRKIREIIDPVSAARGEALTWARTVGCSEEAIDRVLREPLRRAASADYWQGRILLVDARLASERARAGNGIPVERC